MIDNKQAGAHDAESKEYIENKAKEMNEDFKELNEIKADGAAPEEKNEKESSITELKDEKSKMQEFIEFFRDLIVILIIVMIIRTFLIAPFQISGSSMEASYHDKEFIIVNKFSYANMLSIYVGDPIRGDVVIFRPHASNGKEYYIKRVIGLPGDSIKFQDGEVFIKKLSEGEYIKLNEDYLSPINKGKTFLPFDVKETEFKVPAGEYFLVGDNRNNSSDSRSCFMSCSYGGSSHFIKRDDIVGKVLIDFGYFNVFGKNENGEIAGFGKFKWESKPRFFNTPKNWIYNELK